MTGPVRYRIRDLTKELLQVFPSDLMPSNARLAEIVPMMAGARNKRASG
jgi:hypothetical protein